MGGQRLGKARALALTRSTPPRAEGPATPRGLDRRFQRVGYDLRCSDDGGAGACAAPMKQESLSRFPRLTPCQIDVQVTLALDTTPLDVGALKVQLMVSTVVPGDCSTRIVAK
jgi:hypothetical protein